MSDASPSLERFSSDAQTSIDMAREEARRLTDSTVGSSHLLHGIVSAGPNLAAEALARRGVTPESVYRTQLNARYRLGLMGQRTTQTESDGFRRALATAALEADGLGHDSITAAHLLLGLLKDPSSSASHVLSDLGVETASLRRLVLTWIGVPVEKLDAPPDQTLGYATPQGYAQPAAPRDREVIQVGIVGVSGYGGGEVLRLCATHPAFHLVYVAGEGSAGQKLVERFPGISDDLKGLTIQKWNPEQLPDLDVLFASLPSGESKEALARVRPETRIVDIGGDHRFADGWTYGLADVWPEQIRAATRVANPGCYPSASLAALAPLVAAGMVDLESLIIDAKSGVSGAGRGGGNTFGFAEVNESVAAYGLLKHAHVPEMAKALAVLASNGNQPRAPLPITFTPHLIPMTRGILATCYATGTATTADCIDAAKKFYAGRPFVRVVEKPPQTKWATGSNLVYVTYAADPDRKRILALGAIDNLGKGAAGQAVQNANLIMGLDETAGLEGTPLWP